MFDICQVTISKHAQTVRRVESNDHDRLSAHHGWNSSDRSNHWRGPRMNQTTTASIVMIRMNHISHVPIGVSVVEKAMNAPIDSIPATNHTTATKTRLSSWSSSILLTAPSESLRSAPSAA